jgi:pimeloyl-ACP methyl ester carboxylesterase
MDSVALKKADVFGYSMGAITGLQLAIRHPDKVNRLVSASGAYDFRGWQPEFQALIPQMKVDMFPPVLQQEYRKLAPNPNGFPELARKLIGLETEPMAWEADVKAMKTPVLIIAGDHAGGSPGADHRSVSQGRESQGFFRQLEMWK